MVYAQEFLWFNIPMTHTTPSVPETISMQLERYSNIFSDFDAQPYPSRTLSVDFIDELKRAARDKRGGEIELILHIPKQEWNEPHNTAIKERLTTHFKKYYHLFWEEKRRILRIGISMVVMGILCMVAATLIEFKDPSRNLYTSFLIVFLEPAAWFLLWEGMDQIIFNSRHMSEDLDFYRKMSNLNGRIHFKSY